MSLAQEAALELLRRSDSLSSMWSYQEYLATAHADFQYPPAPHHDVMIEALHALERDECKGVIIMAPPGSAKSTYVSVQFATWYWSRHPAHHILACSNTTDLAENFNRRRRNVCFSEEWQRLSGTAVAKDQQGVSRFANNAGGSMTAAGVGAAIVGLRANLLILDDPVMSLEQAMSSTQLDKIWSWFETDARSRLVPTGKTVIVMTRWAKNDPVGRLLAAIARGDEPGWHVVRLPMLADSDNDPMGRPLNEPLWPEWFGEHQITQNQRDPLRWSALYQQKPMDDTGSWVPVEKLITEVSAPDELTYVIAVDLALSVGQGDFTVFTVAGMDSARNLHVVDVRRERIPPNESVDLAFDLTRRYSPTAVLIDDDPAAKVWTRLAYELARERNFYIPLYPLPTRGKNKETRAAAIRGFLLSERVRFVQAPWTADVFHELLEFPSGAHDDIVDTLSLLGRHFVSTSAPSAPVEKNRDPYAGYLVRPDDPTRMQACLDELWDTRPRPSTRI